MAFSSEMTMESEAIKVTPEGPGDMSAVDKTTFQPEKAKTLPRARPCPRSRKPVEARKLLEEQNAKMTEGEDHNPDEDDTMSTGKEEAPEEVSPSPARKRSRSSASSPGGGNVSATLPPEKAKQNIKSPTATGGDVVPPLELDYIIDARTVKEYRCKWKGGLPQDEDTWIHEDDLHCKEAISEFEKRMGVAKNGKEHVGGKKGGPSKDHGHRPSKRPPK